MRVPHFRDARASGATIERLGCLAALTSADPGDARHCARAAGNALCEKRRRFDRLSGCRRWAVRSGLRAGLCLEPRAWLGGADARALLPATRVVLPPDHFRQARNRGFRSGQWCSGSRDEDGRRSRDHGCRGVGTGRRPWLPEGAAMAALFAATYPERTPALVLYGTFLTRDWLPEGQGTYKQLDRGQELEQLERRWGTPEFCDEHLRKDAPSKADDEDFAAGTQCGGRVRRRGSSITARTT